MFDGCNDGFEDGIDVITADGVEEGKSEGNAVGLLVGKMLGASESSLLGKKEGKDVGVKVPKHVPTIIHASFHNMLVVNPGSKPYVPQENLTHSYTIPSDSTVVPML